MKTIIISLFLLLNTYTNASADHIMALKRANIAAPPNSFLAVVYDANQQPSDLCWLWDEAVTPGPDENWNKLDVESRLIAKCQGEASGWHQGYFLPFGADGKLTKNIDSISAVCTDTAQPKNCFLSCGYPWATTACASRAQLADAVNIYSVKDAESCEAAFRACPNYLSAKAAEDARTGKMKCTAEARAKCLHSGGIMLPPTCACKQYRLKPRRLSPLDPVANKIKVLRTEKLKTTK